MAALIRVIKDMGISYKLGLFGFVLVMPTIILLYFFIGAANGNIIFAEKERKGAEYLSSVYPIQQQFAQHRGTMAGLLSGDGSFEAKVTSIENNIPELLAAWKRVDEKYGQEFKTKDRAEGILKGWEQLNGERGLSAMESFEQHSQLLSEVLALMIHVGDQSNLILDPDLDTYYLMDLSVIALPELMEVLGRTRGFSAGLATQREISTEALVKLSIELKAINDFLGRVNAGLQAVYDNTEDSSVKGDLSGLQKTLNTSIEGFDQLVRVEITQKEIITVSADEVFNRGTASIKAAKSLLDQVSPSLSRLLQVRIDKLESARDVQLLVVAVLFLMACCVGWLVSRMVRSGISEVNTIFSEIGKGNYESNIVDIASDELGQTQSALMDLQASMKSNLEDMKSQADFSARIKSALDAAGTSVISTDDTGKIIYMNEAFSRLMSEMSGAIRHQDPAVDVNDLLGKNVSIFNSVSNVAIDCLNSRSGPSTEDAVIAEYDIQLSSSPILSENGNRIGTVIEWVNITEQLVRQRQERKNAQENSRIRQALDVCDTSVMMADEDMNIIYLNDAVLEMMQHAEADLKTVLPNFDAKNLMGFNVDGFHKDPSYQRGVLKDLRTVFKTQLPVAELTFDLTATPLWSEDGSERLGTVVEWKNITDQLALEKKERCIAAENSRIRQALDVCDTSVMMADEDLNIIYLNEAVKEMMENAESQLRTALPSFDAKGLMGFNVDNFHKNPSYQRNLLRDLHESYKTRLPVAGLTFDLIATPLWSEDGNERLGTVVEWKDITEQLAQQQEEQQIAADNSRIKQALDVCDTAVMMADEDLNIIYMNDAVVSMMESRERTIQSELSNFKVKDLIGFNVDGFHKNPGHQRGMLKELKESYKTRLPIAGLNFDLIATPLNAESGERLGTVVEWRDITESLAKEIEEAKIAAENARVRQALDRVAANTMIADADFDIIYMNEAIRGMFQVAESDLRQDLPNFSAGQLMGANIDSFHKNPAHQRNMVGALTKTFQGEIVVGGRTFGLIANPIVDDGGKRLGTVVEWDDRTAEVAIEKEIDDVVEAASSGDFTKTIELSGKEGFFRKLSEGLNSLVETTEIGLSDVIRVLGALAHGDLTERITRDYQGSFGRLKDDSNATAEKLTEVITGIQDAANAVSSGAKEITSGNADLSQRTEEQASSLEETASSMEEMTSAVRASADNATRANTESQNTAATAGLGGDVVQRAVLAMEEINKSSKQIADIIGVIDEIAFQTNLLALNAAVEAARAGEQGRGFAVVAGEVRNLAQRSAEAAREIKDLIRDSVDKVNDGTLLVNESGETLQGIVDAVTNVSAMIQDINSAAIEQTSGIEQVNTAISQMDEMTQQNAALVEEATAAGESMSEQANRMTDMMGFFSIGNSAAKSHAAPIASASVSNAQSAAIAPGNAPVGRSVSDDDEWEEF